MSGLVGGTALRGARAYVGDADVPLTRGYFRIDQVASEFFQKQVVIIESDDSDQPNANRLRVSLHT